VPVLARVRERVELGVSGEYGAVGGESDRDIAGPVSDEACDQGHPSLLGQSLEVGDRLLVRPGIHRESRKAELGQNGCVRSGERVANLPPVRGRVLPNRVDFDQGDPHGGSIAATRGPLR
jgi:hypothetical protein